MGHGGDGLDLDQDILGKTSNLDAGTGRESTSKALINITEKDT